MTSRQVQAVAAVVAVLAYANALANGFVLDDRGVILSNPLVTDPTASWRAFASPYWPEALGGGQYRPLAILSFALDWAVSGGAAWWFHLVNVVWHAIATALLVRVAVELMSPTAALAGGLVFALHPVHVEAVANVVGRSELMAAAFLFAALLLHRRRSLLAVPCFALALLSKEHAIVFVAIAALHDFFLAKGPREPGVARLHVSYAVATLAWLAIMAFVLRDVGFSTTTDTYAGASSAERLLTVLAVVPHYLRLLVAPSDLSGDYEPQVIPLASSFGAPQVLGALLIVGTIGALVVALRRRAHAAAFALSWVAVALAPVSNVLIVTGVTLAERTLYLASAGVAILAGLGFEALVRVRRSLGLATAGLLAVAFAFRTWTRTPVWKSDRSYLLALLESHPESYRGHWVAGRVLLATGDRDAASRELALARTLFDRHPRLYRESAEVELARGDAPRARALVDSALALAPHDSASIALLHRLGAAQP